MYFYELRLDEYDSCEGITLSSSQEFTFDQWWDDIRKACIACDDINPQNVANELCKTGKYEIVNIKFIARIPQSCASEMYSIRDLEEARKKDNSVIYIRSNLEVKKYKNMKWIPLVVSEK